MLLDAIVGFVLSHSDADDDSSLKTFMLNEGGISGRRPQTTTT